LRKKNVKGIAARQRGVYGDLKCIEPVVAEHLDEINEVLCQKIRLKKTTETLRPIDPGGIITPSEDWK